MTSEVPVRLPGWAAWPRTVWVPEEAALRTTGELESPGLFVFEGAVYVILVIAVLWLAVGSPAVITGRWIAIAFQLAGNNTPGWLAAGIVAASVPVYSYVWWPAMIRLFGERFAVTVTAEEVRVTRGRSGTVTVARDPEDLEVILEEHVRSKAAARAPPGREGTDGLYRHSFEAVLRVAETRIVIAAVAGRDEEQGRALVLRVKGTIVNFAKIAQAAGGRAAGPVAADYDVYE